MIRATKHIYRLLSGNEYIKNKTQSRIYPLVAEDDDKYPFIIYSRIQHEVNRVKFGISSQLLRIEVNVVSASYDDSMDIALAVIDILDGQVIDDVNIIFVSSNEQYNNAYIQTLIFKIE